MYPLEQDFFELDPLDMANSKDEGVGRADQGQGIVMANSEGEGAGRTDQGHDSDVANSEGEGAGQSD